LLKRNYKLNEARTAAGTETGKAGKMRDAENGKGLAIGMGNGDGDGDRGEGKLAAAVMVAAKNSVIMRKDARLAMKRKEGRKDEPAEEDEQIDQRMMYRRRLQDTIPERGRAKGLGSADGSSADICVLEKVAKLSNSNRCS